MCFKTVLSLVIVQLLWIEGARAAPRRDSVDNNKLAELIEEQLTESELEIDLKEILEVRAESYDALTDTETTIVVFPIEVDHNSVGHIFTDYAANEMIARLDGDIKVFEEMKKRIHFLEKNMNKHKNVHLVDDKQIEDAQTILEVMNKKMLIPFRANLEAIKEEIIKMDHTLKGGALDYVKKLTERAESFIEEAHEKLEIVVEADEDWNNEENTLVNKAHEQVNKDEEGVFTSDDFTHTMEESSSSNVKSISGADEISIDLIDQESFEEDAASKYKKWKNIKSNHPSNDINLNNLKLVLLNQVDENLVTTEKAILEISEPQENFLEENKEDEGKKVEENKEDEGKKVEENIEDEGKKVNEEVEEIPKKGGKINSNVKLLLEKTNFWKINEKLSPHKHEHGIGSWAMVIGLPFIILVPLLAILAGLFAICKLKKKEIISVQRNNYPCHLDPGQLEKISTSTLESFPNYNKLK